MVTAQAYQVLPLCLEEPFPFYRQTQGARDPERSLVAFFRNLKRCPTKKCNKAWVLCAVCQRRQTAFTEPVSQYGLILSFDGVTSASEKYFLLPLEFCSKSCQVSAGGVDPDVLQPSIRRVNQVNLTSGQGLVCSGAHQWSLPPQIQCSLSLPNSQLPSKG